VTSPPAASGAAAPPARPAPKNRWTLVGLAVVVLALPAAWTAWRAGPGGTTVTPADPVTPVTRPAAATVVSDTPTPPAPAAARAAATATPSGSAPAGKPPATNLVLPQAGIDEMLAAPAASHWRAWRFQANPAVLVIEFPSLQDQGLAMNRMAALFEKRNAPRDRVLDDAELAALVQSSGDSTASFYQGHDYPAVKVARFFTLAASTATALNPQERQLLATLQGAGVLAADGAAGFGAPGLQAVVSFTALQADDPTTAADETIDPVRRKAVLRHELSHGEYFTNPSYRLHSQAFWSRRLSAAERKGWKKYLESLDYDPGDEDLMANETQAMLMHTPDPRAFNAGALGISDAALAAQRARFRAGEPLHGLASPGR
jgi:hypothetical protein